MLFFLAQAASDVAPVASGAFASASGGLDWVKLALAAFALLSPVIYLILASKNAKAAVVVKIMQDAADRVQHGEGWAQASIEAAQDHSSAVTDLLVSAIPDSLLPQAPPPKALGLASETPTPRPGA
jgi:hypothetical protein